MERERCEFPLLKIEDFGENAAIIRRGHNSALHQMLIRQFLLSRLVRRPTIPLLRITVCLTFVSGPSIKGKVI